MRIRSAAAFGLLCAGLVLGGCHGTGAVVGAATGAAVGHAVGGSPGSAAAGAAAGAATGAVLEDAYYRRHGDSTDDYSPYR